MSEAEAFLGFTPEEAEELRAAMADWEEEGS